MEQDISTSVEEDLAEAIQEITPQDETLLHSDVPTLKTSKKISEKLDDTEKEKDELQIEEITADTPKGTRDKPKTWQKPSTEAPKEKTLSSKKTEEVKLQKVPVERIQAKHKDEDPWVHITLNRCIIAAAVIVVLSMGVQLIVGIFDVDDSSVLAYSDMLLDDEDLKLAERTMVENRDLTSDAEEAISELEKFVIGTPARTELKKPCIALKGKTGGCKSEVANKKQISPHIKEIKSIKSSYKPRDKDSEPRSGKDRKDHKIEVEKKDDKHFKKEDKHRGHLEQHFKGGDSKKLSKGKEEGCEKGSKFNQHHFPRRLDKNVKQETHSKHQDRYKDFEKHKYYFKQNDNKKHDYKVHKEYSKHRVGKHGKHYGIEKILKKSGMGKHFGKNKFKESRKHE